MMLNLVVEPHLQPIANFIAAFIIGGADDLAQIKLIARLHRLIEAVEILAGMIGPDDQKGVDIGKDLGPETIDKDIARRNWTQRQKKTRDDCKAPGRMRQQ